MSHKRQKLSAQKHKQITRAKLTPFQWVVVGFQFQLQYLKSLELITPIIKKRIGVQTENQ